MSTQYIVVVTSNDNLSENIKTDTGSPKESLESLSQYMAKLALGCGEASVDIQTGGTAASGTITFSSLVADDTITVGGVTFTAKVSPSGANQFALGATDTTAAADAAAKINAHNSLTGVATATSAAAVITVTAAHVGTEGNQIGLAISANGSVSGALLTGGTEPTSHLMHAGL